MGSARPSHLMFTAGIGSLVDLPNFSVLVKGLEAWNYGGLAGYTIDEPRLRTAVNRRLQLYGNTQITELRSAPWMAGSDSDAKGWHAQGVGVPVSPFPQWLRCTGCNLLAPIDSEAFAFLNGNPRTPHEARFVHAECGRAKRKPLAVTARFTLVCTNGHLDEFPYTHFVHRGQQCPKNQRPLLRMTDHGGNLTANVTLQCVACQEKRNIREAMGERGASELPRCRGRHPHLSSFAPDGCEEQPTLMVAGASNQWFPLTLSTLALPPAPDSGIDKLLEERWSELQHITTPQVFDAISHMPGHGYLKEYDRDALLAAIQARLNGDTGSEEPKQAAPDLLGPEWDVLAGTRLPTPTDDFTLEETEVSGPTAELFASVRQVQRLREVRAQIGFTRLDAPDPDNPEIARPVRLWRSSQNWVPASEVRGEGIFLRVREDLMGPWAERMQKSAVMQAHREAYVRFRKNRRSGRLSADADFDPMAGWPGERYLALHTFSHALIRTIALECGYSSASLAERIYAGDDEKPRTGILLYTAVPDSEGTLGGLVALAESPHFDRIVRRALRDAARCSSDPLCSERLPRKPADYLHGAACHACLFVSETTCERGNRFLDRRFLVPLGENTDEVLTPHALRP
ncbi:DrmB family protein [Streptomyces fungicidicus]